jgi:hypothetical protein
MFMMGEHPHDKERNQDDRDEQNNGLKVGEEQSEVVPSAAERISVLLPRTPSHHSHPANDNEQRHDERRDLDGRADADADGELHLNMSISM